MKTLSALIGKFYNTQNLPLLEVKLEPGWLPRSFDPKGIKFSVVVKDQCTFEVILRFIVYEDKFQRIADTIRLLSKDINYPTYQYVQFCFNDNFKIHVYKQSIKFYVNEGSIPAYFKNQVTYSLDKPELYIPVFEKADDLLKSAFLRVPGGT